MNYLISILAATLLLPGILLPSFSPENQSTCKVLLASISGNYEGECKKRLAHGNGTATGKDVYVGEFKKGLPHGEGRYTWKNGDVFEGNWKNGLKEGKGKFTDADSSVLLGYWIKDEYIGEEKEPYKIVTKSPLINKITAKRISAEPHQVDVFFEQNHRQLSNVAISKTGEGFSKFIPGSERVLVSVNAEQFPFLGYMEFSAKSWITKELLLDNSFDIKISQPGHWKIVVEMVATE